MMHWVYDGDDQWTLIEGGLSVIEGAVFTDADPYASAQLRDAIASLSSLRARLAAVEAERDEALRLIEAEENRCSYTHPAGQYLRARRAEQNKSLFDNAALARGGHCPECGMIHAPGQNTLCSY